MVHARLAFWLGPAHPRLCLQCSPGEQKNPNPPDESSDHFIWGEVSILIKYFLSIQS